MVKKFKKPTDTLTFYTCVKCGNALLDSIVNLAVKKGISLDKITCPHCILSVKINENIKKEFVFDEFDFDYKNYPYHFKITADEMFNEMVEITSDDVVIYLTDFEQTPEGRDVYAAAVFSGKIIERKRH